MVFFTTHMPKVKSLIAYTPLVSFVAQVYSNKKAEHTKGLSFGSSAIFTIQKTRHFPPPPCEEFGFVGNQLFEYKSEVRIINDCDYWKKYAGPLLVKKYLTIYRMSIYINKLT